jgi:hypothetical protein
MLALAWRGATMASRDSLSHIARQLVGRNPGPALIAMGVYSDS